MFKPGDKVRCIDPSGHEYGSIRLIYNSVYIVETFHEKTQRYCEAVKLKDIDYNYYSSRFIKYNEVIFKKEEDYYKWLAKR